MICGAAARVKVSSRSLTSKRSTKKRSLVPMAKDVDREGHKSGNDGGSGHDGRFEVVPCKWRFALILVQPYLWLL